MSELHLEHSRSLFFSERPRPKAIRVSVGMPVSIISLAVFALNSLSVELDAERWREAMTLAVLMLTGMAIVAFFASAWQVALAE